MSRRLATAIAATATILVVASAAMAPGAGAGSQPRLLPDLVTLRLSQNDVVLEPSGGKLFLRLSNEIGCLVSTADPHNLLRESDNSNNARRARVALHPAKHTVERLPGHCRRYW
jgi:hypothetical protein